MAARSLIVWMPAYTALTLAAATAALTLGPSTAATAAPSAADPPPCGSQDLTVTLDTHGGGTAGSLYARLVLHNTAPVACRTGGYAGVSYITTPSRTQIGAPADWADHAQTEPLLLGPGGRAVATLREVDAGNYPTALCRPQLTDGLRVYPPNQTTATILTQHTLACANPAVHLLTLTPFRQR